MLQMVSKLSTSKMKFYQIFSNISGSTGWHLTEEITDRYVLFNYVKTAVALFYFALLKQGFQLRQKSIHADSKNYGEEELKS